MGQERDELIFIIVILFGAYKSLLFNNGSIGNSYFAFYFSKKPLSLSQSSIRSFQEVTGFSVRRSP